MKKPRTFPRAEALEVHPTAYLTKARAFFSAAERLLNPNDAFDAPVNFLHGHAMELAFKAFLRTKDVIAVEKFKTHVLSVLCEECQARGLVVGPDDKTDLGNVVGILDHMNEAEGLRYFNPDLSMLPDPTWTHNTVGQLITVVASHVEAYSRQHPPDTTTKRQAFILGKPYNACLIHRACKFPNRVPGPRYNSRRGRKMMAEK